MRSQNNSWQAQAEKATSCITMSNMLLSIATLSSFPAVVLLASAQVTEGFSTMQLSANNVVKPADGWKKCQDIGDFATGLALFGTGIYAIKIILEAAPADDCFFPDVVSIVAIGQAVKSGYNFIKAASILLSSQETEEKLNEQRREVLFHGLKFVGYTLISCGFSPAGAAFLGAALAVALYNNCPRVQRFCDSMVTFFTPGAKQGGQAARVSISEEVDSTLSSSPRTS